MPKQVSTYSSTESVEKVMMHKDNSFQHGHSETNGSPFQHGQNATLDVKENVHWCANGFGVVGYELGLSMENPT